MTFRGQTLQSATESRASLEESSSSSSSGIGITFRTYPNITPLFLLLFPDSVRVTAKEGADYFPSWDMTQSAEVVAFFLSANLALARAVRRTSAELSSAGTAR